MTRNRKGGRQARRERYLCTTSGVLCSTAGYELCVVVLKQVFVEAHVLVLGEDGIVRFESVLGEHCFIARYTKSVFCERWDGMLEITLGPGYLKSTSFSL